MSENFFSKDEPAINEHHYHITKQQYNEEANNTYNIDKSKTFNIKDNLLNEQHFPKKQNINNNTISNITKNTVTNNNGNVLNAKKDYSYKTCVGNYYNPQIAYVENNLYKRYDNRTFSNTTNIHKHINQYSTDVFNNYKINKTM